MKTFALKTEHKKILADTITPVSVYLKLRDVFPHSLLLESSDYHANNNDFSYICCNPIASIELKNNILTTHFPDKSLEVEKVNSMLDIPERIHKFSQQFESERFPFKFISNGIFGYVAHDAVDRFENIELNKTKPGQDIPDIYYAVYQNIIAISLFNHEAHLFSHIYGGDHNLTEIEVLLQAKNNSHFNFEKVGEKSSNLSDEQFINFVKKGKEHCFRGDVFQLVLSRCFSQGFKGDEFNVYRTLRSINPSPYLFFFDYGYFKIFGSSPEAQLIVQSGKAEIHPIAGTFRRTGDDEKDAVAAGLLAKDPKENSEHVMLVDLARNDLSRNGSEVVVEKNREIQFYSHVIHLVSKVSCTMKKATKTFRVVADTFPAGTLSGAPKHRALQLIDQYETTKRNVYGGAIGYMDFHGNFNHAIIIRSFLSKNHELHYQAGAGIVADSVPENELQEVYNKLGALDKALTLAEDV
ncbi:anthranilate synthase component I family protein [Flavobacteriaceae bacterium]|jgi:anthranilate synthase component 1|nr:anthranilate synthase component I family protein [Flavobacteriaceae bacterium]|tara:strand:+ start:461 stop:1861 length:1401 start_codon:yes stop_codon:yes gene_type:complete